MRILYFLLLHILVGATPVAGQTWSSSRVFYAEDGSLQYRTDAEGNRIPDFSHAGYHQGEHPLPDVPTVVTLAADADDQDDALRINEAIDEAAALGGGAVRLQAGTYEIHQSVLLDRSGVVLRGDGDGDDPASSTILRSYGGRYAEVMRNGKRSPAWLLTPRNPNHGVVVVGSASFAHWNPPRDAVRDGVPITTPFVGVGSYHFDVARTQGLSIGDTVVVVHPCTDAWIEAVDRGGVDFRGEADPEDFWTCDDGYDIAYRRRIAGLHGNTVRLDAPVFMHLDQSLSQSYLHPYTEAIQKTPFVREVGVEDLQIVISYEGQEDGYQSARDTTETQPANALFLLGVENGWVKGCTFRHFTNAGIFVSRASQVTVAESRALEPVSRILGGRRYNFTAGGWTQHILVRDSRASHARHAFIVNGGWSASDIVFVRDTSQYALGGSGGHQYWSQGLLYDNLIEEEPVTGTPLTLYNRVQWGGHGWAEVHSVAWNVHLAGQWARVQKPPTAQNYLIGYDGRWQCGHNQTDPICQTRGFVEPNCPATSSTCSSTRTGGLHPSSLYEAQFQERVGARGGRH